MKTISYVLPEEAALARFMETKLLSYPEESGILFVGVKIDISLHTDTKGQHREALYKITVGLDRKFEENVADPLVRMILREELGKGVSLSVSAHRGAIRKPLTGSTS